jgi:FMN phosphatase YigB (HAD superfamily)
MFAGRRIALFDLFGVIALDQIPVDHADAFFAAQPWLRNLDYVAFSGKIKAAKPDPAAFRHCVAAMHAAPADFLFIDDRAENVRAAQTVGMAGHVFTGLEELETAINPWLPAVRHHLLTRTFGVRVAAAHCAPHDQARLINLSQATSTCLRPRQPRRPDRRTRRACG